ncbi:MAG: hypothetical protein NTW67_05745 [Candidatus Woesearchaeota archaeon]|nr:hypothetical protein [Candidatus Woesearchaeota archaeon]
MAEDTIIAYGRIAERGDTRVLAMFGTTNRWFYMQNYPTYTEQEVQDMELHCLKNLRALAQKHGISKLEEETIVLTGKLQQEDDDFTKYQIVGHVGEFNNEKDCLEFVKIAIRSLFTGIKKGNADCEQTLKGLVNPLVDAVSTRESEKLFDTQARLIEAYRGPPLHNYIQKLCRMIRHERSPDLIKLQIELITAIEQGEYETAARADRTIMHTPLDNRAQGI